MEDIEEEMKMMYRKALHDLVWITLLAVFALTLAGCRFGSGVFGTDGEDPDAPSAPETPTIVAGDGQLGVSWTAVSGATSYEVWYGTSINIDSASQFQLQFYTNSCTITGLTNGTTYYVWVKAKNSGGGSGFSDPATGVPAAPTDPPDAPAAPTLSTGYQKITATWTAVSGATGYEVWYGSTDSSDEAAQFGSDVSGTSCIITGLTNGSTYSVWLKAKNSAGTSAFSPSATAILDEAASHDTGDSQTWTIGEVSFDMVFAPAVSSFPTGLDDDGTGSVDSAFWIGKTEVTYALWSAVYAWATSDDRGAAKYTFAYAGQQGYNYEGSTTSGHPVVKISWRDAMIWCNALTEYYNAENGTSYACVYCSDAACTTPIRAVTSDTAIYASAGDQDNPYVNESSTGFRMPSDNEWEMSARYKGGDSSNGAILMGGLYWTPGDYASGASDDVTDSSATQSAGWFYENSSYRTHLPGELAANALGLYDMSGNAEEWCTGYYLASMMSYRSRRGSCFASYATGLGRIYYQNYADFTGGFRLARMQ